MAETTEIGQRILSELDEFKKENVYAMLNTIVEPTGNPDEVVVFARSLNDLVERDLVWLGLETFYPVTVDRFAKSKALELVDALLDWFRFDSTRGIWTLKAGDIKKEKTPAIYLTAPGQREAHRVLDRRGYQWWRRKD